MKAVKTFCWNNVRYLLMPLIFCAGWNGRSQTIVNRGMQHDVGQWMDVTPATDLKLPVFTVECWIKSKDRIIIASRMEKNSTLGAWIFVYDWANWAQQHLSFITNVNSGPDTTYATRNYTGGSTDWNHVALVVNGPNGTIRMYVNGIDVYNDVFIPTRTFGSGAGLAWGGYYNNPSGGIGTGTFDEARYWSVERTEAQIQAAMNSRLSPTDRVGLVGYWSFCGNFADSSGNRNNGIPRTGAPIIDITDLLLPLGCCEPVTPVITAIGPVSICEGDSVVFDAGDFPTYSWSNGSTSRRITAKNDGDYVVTVSNRWGCSGSDTATVAVHPYPLPVISGPAVVCTQTQEAYSATSTTGNSYDWSIIGGTGTISSGMGTSDISVYWRMKGKAVIRLRESTQFGCVKDTTMNVIVGSSAPPVISASGATSCCAGDSVTLDAGTGFAQYAWNTGAATQRITVRSTGLFIVATSDSLGCGGSDTVAVNVFANPLPKIIPSGSTALCAGDSVTLDAGAGYQSYAWSNGAVSQTNTVGLKGTYRVIVTDANGCTGLDSIAVTAGSTAIVNIKASGPTRLCEGDSVALDAGIGYVSYRWSNGSRFRNIIANKTGLYVVTVTSPGGCTGSDSISVTVSPLPTPSVTASGSAEFCAGDSLRLSLDKQYASMLWNTGETGGSIIVKQSGAYSVTVTDSDGCPGSASFPQPVNVHPKPSPVISGPASVCLKTSAQYSVDSAVGNSYEWTLTGGNGTILSATNAREIQVRWTSAGNGILHVREQSLNGCITDTSITVIIGTSLSPFITTPGALSICEGDSLTLDAGAGYSSYVWSNGKTDQQITVKASGSFTVNVSDANGCSGTSQPVVVTVHAYPSAVMTGPSSICINTGAVFIVRDGIAASGNGWKLHWTKGRQVGVSITDTITLTWTEACIDTLRLTVSNAYGCSSSAEYIVRVNATLQPLIKVSGSKTLCRGDSVKLDAGSGFSNYQWNTGATTPTITVWDAGQFFVQVSDAGGCSGVSDTIAVQVHELPKPVISGALKFCAGDSTVLDAGAGFITYEWTDGSAKRTITVKQSGMYGVTVQNADGCTGSSPLVAVSAFPKPAAPTIMRQGDTLFSSLASSYQWFRNDTAITDGTNGSYVVKSEGVYKVRIKDGNGCEAESDTMHVVFNTTTATSSFALSCLTPNVFNPGETAVLKVRLASSTNLQGGPLQCRVQLRFNRSVLSPGFAYQASRFVNNERILSLSLTRPTGLTSGTLLELPFTVMLGDAECARVTLDSVVWLSGGATVSLENQDCDICVKVCREGGTRLFSSNVKVQLFQNRPNPFNAMTVIGYEVIEKGPTSLTVSDMLGRKIATLVDSDVEPGRYSVTFDAASLSSGVYFAILRTPTVTQSRLMTIMK